MSALTSKSATLYTFQVYLQTKGVGETSLEAQITFPSSSTESELAS